MKDSIQVLRKPGMDLRHKETGVVLEVSDTGFDSYRIILQGKGLNERVSMYVTNKDDLPLAMEEFVNMVVAFGQAVVPLVEAWKKQTGGN